MPLAHVDHYAPPDGPERLRLPQAGKSVAGAWLHNPVTGELARVNVSAADTSGRRIKSDLWLQPGAAVAGAHVHPHLIERFEVLAGEVGFRVADRERTVGSGDGVVQIDPDVVHDWWNAAPGVAHVRVEIEAAPSAPGQPAARFASLAQTMWSLAALGRVNAHGIPDLLWLAAIANEYRDAVRFSRPPAVLQHAAFAPLAALARRRGRDLHDPRLHGPTAACLIAEPSEPELTALLHRSVAAARRRKPG